MYRLQPYLYDKGVMRMRGRIDAATQLPVDTWRPILLPRKHALTDLIVMREHERMKHQNDDAIVCALRAKYWVSHARTAVRRAKTSCQFCKVTRARPVAPLMGSLPADRLVPVERPFTYTSLDYFTRLEFYLELAADLITDACILCIRNFVNTRGLPVRIRSDNGTNFVGADRELRANIAAFDQDAIKRECTGCGIEWRFNCPSNPEVGGCWKRLVRSVKRVLAVTMTESAPRVETLRSLLIEAANIVNFRPLTYLPVESDADEPLTPNHFLIGTVNSTQTPGPVDSKAYCTRKQWSISQDLKNRFWKRWTQEYKDAGQEDVSWRSFLERTDKFGLLVFEPQR